MKSSKQLVRSKSNRTMSGVLGGVGEYFGIDPVLVRVGYVLLTAFTGFIPGIVAYVLMILIIPESN